MFEHRVHCDRPEECGLRHFGRAFSTGCQTAWARFTCKQSGGCTNFVFWIHRVNDNLSENFYMTYPASMGNGTQRWSPQLYDGGGYEAYACFQRYFGGPSECNPVY